jgi:hypothetical protein
MDLSSMISLTMIGIFLDIVKVSPLYSLYRQNRDRVGGKNGSVLPGNESRKSPTLIRILSAR